MVRRYAVALLALAACSDLSNLSGGSTDPDASTTAAEAGATDASPGTSARFCDARDAAATVFCDDFDDPGRNAMTQAGWQRIFGYPLGDIVSDQAYSAPRSALFRFDSDGGAPRVSAQKILNFAADKTELVVSARARVVSGTDTADFTLSDDNWSFRWNLASGEVHVYTGGGGQPGFSAVAPPTDAWSAVRLSVKRGASDFTLTARVGEGPSAVSIDQTFATKFTTAVGIDLGDSNNDSNGAVYFDDVAVDVF